MGQNINSMSPQFTLLDQLWYKDLFIQGNTILWPVNKWFGNAWRLESRKKL